MNSLSDQASACSAIIAASLDAIIIVDQGQRIIIFNSAAEQLYGYQANEIIGQPIERLIPERFRMEHQAHIRHFTQSSKSARMMGQFGRVYGLHRDGHEFPAEASIANLQQNGNQYYSVILRSLSEQQRSEETIRLSEQRFQTLISNLRGVVYRCELSTPWHVSFISDGTEEMTGYPPIEFLKADSIDWAHIVHPDDLDMVDKVVNRAVANGKQYEMQYRIIHKNGSVQWVQEKGIAIYDGDQPLYLDGFIHNITEQKHAEEQQLLLKNAAIENSISAIAIASIEGELIFANQAYVKMLGFADTSQVLGRKVSDLWADRKETELIVHSIKTKGYWTGRRHGIRKNGSEFIAESSASLVYDNQGKPTHMFASFIDVTEQQEARLKLKESYQLLDAVFENTHVLIAILDPELRYIRVNQTYAKANGKPAEYFIGKNHFTLFPNAEFEAVFRSAVSTGTRIDMRAKPFAHGHDEKQNISYWDWTLTPIKDSDSLQDNKVSSLVLSMLDVTDRIVAIEYLDKREHELRVLNETLEEKVRLRTNELAAFNAFTETIFNTVGALIVVLDREGRIIRFNHACELVSGYSAEQALGRCPWDFLLPPEEQTSVHNVFLSLKAGHYPNTHENFWLNKIGQKRWISWSNSALTDAQGDVDYIIATGLDITDKRQAETNLRESEFQFRLLAENIQDVFWLTSPDRKTMYYISPAYETVWGRPRSEAYENSKSFLDSVHEDDLALLLEDHQAQREGRFEDYYEREFRIYRSDGALRWIRSSYGPITDSEGNIYRIAGISSDITETKLAQDARLQHEREQRDNLVREVHHRIKNNLQGVLGLLRQHTREKPEIRPAMDTAITQISTMALVHGLQSNNPGERIQLKPLCGAITSSIAGMTGIPIDTRDCARVQEPITIKAEEAVPLALIFNELIFNAVKHTDPSEPVVIMSLQRDDQAARITIINPCNSWNTAPDIMQGINLGTGLSLVRALLPEQMVVSFDYHDGLVHTMIEIRPPVIE